MAALTTHVYPLPPDQRVYGTAQSLDDERRWCRLFGWIPLDRRGSTPRVHGGDVVRCTGLSAGLVQAERPDHGPCDVGELVVSLTHAVPTLTYGQPHITPRHAKNVFNFGIPLICNILGYLGVAASFKWHWGACIFGLVAMLWYLTKSLFPDADLTGE